jgi:hypothetical protein
MSPFQCRTEATALLTAVYRRPVERRNKGESESEGTRGNVGSAHPLLVPLSRIRTSDGGSGSCAEPNWGKRWDRHRGSSRKHGRTSTANKLYLVRKARPIRDVQRIEPQWNKRVAVVRKGRYRFKNECRGLKQRSCGDVQATSEKGCTKVRAQMNRSN